MATGIPTFEQFRRSLAGTPMSGEAQGIYNAALRGGINPAFVAGLASAESGYGKEGYAVGKNNPFGLGVHLGWRFKNYTEATKKLAKTLNSLRYPELYKQRGLAGIISQYTPASDGNDESAHARNIISAGRRTGGNPSKVYTGSAVVPMAPSPGGGAAMMPEAMPSVSPQPPSSGVTVSNELRQALVRQYQMSKAGTLTPEVARKATLGLARLAGAQYAQSLMPQSGSAVSSPAAASSGTTPTPSSAGGPVETAMTGYGSTRGVVRPLPTPLGAGDYGYADKEGQDGRHLADDWFAPANTPVAAPVSGTVFRVKPDKEVGKKSVGQVFGGTVYIRDKGGRIFVFRHLENPQRYTQAGQQVTAGQRIGAVKAWGTAPHTHIEMYRPGPYSYSSARAMDPNQFFQRAGIR
jgi:murein DD-endopeptidase MepM/ murein hydrolase activator NlpD